MNFKVSISVKIVIAILLLPLTSCQKTEDKKKVSEVTLTNTPEPIVKGGWRKMGHFFNKNCKVHYLFSANGKAYLWLTRFVTEDMPLPDLKSNFYEYDPNTNTFSPKASLPEDGRGLECWSMVIGQRAFYGLEQKIWEYDFTLDKWIAKNNFRSIARFPAIFVANGRGYMAGFQGENGYRSNDTLYEYNPDNDTWKALHYLPGNRYTLFKMAFSLNNTGYIFGTNESAPGKGALCWMYDADSVKWRAKVNCPRDAQAHVYFTRNNKGYIYCGSNINSQAPGDNSIYEFDPVTNSWTQQANFPGSIKATAVGFTIDNKSYIGFGYTETYTKNLDNDLWEYNP